MIPALIKASFNNLFFQNANTSHPIECAEVFSVAQRFSCNDCKRSRMNHSERDGKPHKKWIQIPFNKSVPNPFPSRSWHWPLHLPRKFFLTLSQVCFFSRCLCQNYKNHAGLGHENGEKMEQINFLCALVLHIFFFFLAKLLIFGHFLHSAATPKCEPVLCGVRECTFARVW